MSSVRVEKTNAVARVILNRPPLNVVDVQALRELRDAFDGLRNDKSKVIVLTAEGKAFSAGVDIKDHTADKVGTMMGLLREVFEKLWALEQPTVAIVQGAALGGGLELAIGCDFIIASESAQFAQPEIKVGVFPPIACLLLPRLIPWAKALELVLTGDSINAQEAYHLGLVNRVVAPAQLETEATAFVNKLAESSGPVLKMTKRAALIGLGEEWSVGRMQCYGELERLYLDEMMKLEDTREGLQAFMEKRKPIWQER